MNRFDDLPSIRQEYGTLDLLESTLHKNPIDQFEDWFTQHLQAEKNTPNAMVLSTVDQHGSPDSRVVLLKELDNGAFVFYTNYYSVKGLQLDHNPHAALNFYWPELMRQVRVRGVVNRVSKQQADEYFYSRPIASQLSTIASPQSAEISSREELDNALAQALQDYADKKIIRPDHWGGYAVTPEEVEFWQGRDNRLHDRLQYYRKRDTWCCRRLAP
ncbi:MAG: pyridoxamine 5'-phosphate oxidase [Legionellaceae bacterium]|nr:pyridoxamine 5'-phosphate oxidase [Legionellaceae bacterium]